MTNTIPIAMYKMARKPVPQHVEAAPSAHAIIIEDIKLPIIDYETPPLPITSQYRSFPRPHNYSSSDTFYELQKMSNGQVKTATSELADFLKSSKPEDFGSSVVTGSMEDLSLSGSSNKKKHRFLRSSTPRDAEKNRTQSPLPFRPPHVTPKLTSKGSHYLQIQVDYGNMGNQAGCPLREPPKNAALYPTLDSINIYSEQRVTKGETAETNQLTQHHMNMSPPPWSPPEPKPPAIDRMNTYQTFLRTNTGPSYTQQRRTPVLPALKTDFGGPQAKIPQIQHHIPRTLYSPTREIEIANRISSGSAGAGSYYSSSAPQDTPPGENHSHTRTSPQGVPIHSSGRAEANAFAVEHTIPQSDHTQHRKLPNPGPPPSRALPSPPEIHDISTLSGRSSFPNQVAFCPGQPLSPSPVGKDEARVNDRWRREDRVNARKAKDIKLMQQRKLQAAIRLLDADAEIKEMACNAVPIVSSVSPFSTSGLPTRRRSSQRSPVNDTTAMEGTPEVHQSDCLQLLTHDAPTPPRSPSPFLRLTTSVQSGAKSSQVTRQAISEEYILGLIEETMAKQIELEDKIESIEHRYSIIEQALITMLQRTSPHKNESNSIKSLLADFRITHPCRGWSEANLMERDRSQTDHC